MSDTMKIFGPREAKGKLSDRRQGDKHVTISLEEYREFVEARLLLGMAVAVYERAEGYVLPKALRPILGTFEEEDE